MTTRFRLGETLGSSPKAIKHEIKQKSHFVIGAEFAKLENQVKELQERVATLESRLMERIQGISKTKEIRKEQFVTDGKWRISHR